MPISPVLSLEQFRAKLHTELNAVLSEHVKTAAAIDPLFGELVTTFYDYMTRSGKRLRPYLMYLAFVGYDGQANDTDLIRATLSQELFHNAWLIHDDIIDRDTIRHGGLNITGVYERELKSRRIADAAHLATSAALVTGDLSLALAAELIARAPFAPERVIAATTRLHEVSFTETGGEMIDVLLPSVPLASITPNRLLTMYRYKTAAYSFELPLQTGAMLAGASKMEISGITELATPWGIAFQLTDDLLGTFAAEQQLGKSVLSDLREGKRTMLYLLGLQLSNASQRKRLKTLAGDPQAGYHQLAEMRAILETTGAKQRTIGLAEDHINQAFSALQKLKLRTDVAAILHDLAQFSVQRQT